MATMIAAMTTTAVFSVILSSFVGGAKADKRDTAAAIMRRAQETLRSYVSVDPYNSVYSAGPLGSPGRWPADNSGTWALRAGPHDISSLLTGTPLAGAGASFTYTVANSDCLGLIPAGGDLGPNGEFACKTVVFNLVYPD